MKHHLPARQCHSVPVELYPEYYFTASPKLGCNDQGGRNILAFFLQLAYLEHYCFATSMLSYWFSFLVLFSEVLILFSKSSVSCSLLLLYHYLVLLFQIFAIVFSLLVISNLFQLLFISFSLRNICPTFTLSGGACFISPSVFTSSSKTAASLLQQLLARFLRQA